MNITSVSNTELYSIVTGNKFAWIHSDVTKAKEYTDQDKLEMSKDYIDSTSIGSLVKSGLSEMDNFSISDDDLAKHLGQMGYRIDKAYESGILSEEDYKTLCGELEKYTDEAIYNVEYKRCADISIKEGMGAAGIYSGNTVSDIRSQVEHMMNQAEKEPQPWQVNREAVLKLANACRNAVNPYFKADNITINLGLGGGENLNSMKNLADIMKDLPSIDITDDIKSGKLKPAELKDLSVTVVNTPSPQEKFQKYGLTDMEVYALFTGKPVRDPIYRKGPDGEITHDCINTTFMFNSDGSIKDMYKNDSIAFLKHSFLDQIGSGLPNNIPTNQRLAEHYGGIAQRIDQAYASGKCNKEQHENLRKLMKDSLEESLSSTEKARAMKEWGASWFEKSPQERALRTSQGSEKYMEKRESEIEDLIWSKYRIDRKMMNELIESIRNDLSDKEN